MSHVPDSPEKLAADVIDWLSGFVPTAPKSFRERAVKLGIEVPPR